MEKKLFLILVIVCVATHTIRSIYEILKHKKIVEPDKFTFIVVFTNMMLLWVSWFGLCSLDIYRIDFNIIVRVAGVLLSCLGLLVFLVGLFTIKTLESYDGELITKGIYSKVRHPMYLGFILWLIGFPIIFGSIFSLFLSALFIINVLFWRHLEEIELEKRFSAYPDYKKTTLF